MFNKNLIVAVKANKRVLRELKDTCFIPFGQEYSILIKNVDSRRASVRIWIDGTDVTDGTSLVVNANSEVEIERFIKNNNLDAGNKFKFIEKTAQIEKHRGSKIDDGFIRVEFQFEKLQPQINSWDPYYASPTIWTNDLSYKGSPSPLRGFGGSLSASGTVATASIATNAINTAYTAQTAGVTQPDVTLTTSNAVFNDAGITVPGSKSEQKFATVGWFPVEAEKHVIMLKLLGESPEGKKVEAPVTVKAKPKCETCGRTNKATAKFCSECGTSLVIF